MMKRLCYAVSLWFFLWGATAVLQAQDWREDVSVTLDFTYASKYIWHGFDIFEGNGSFQPSLTVQYKNLYAGVWMAQPETSGFEELQEVDYYIGYDHSFFEEERYAVDVSLLYTYFDLLNDTASESQEIAVGFSMPQLLPLWGSYLVPGYTAYYEFEGFPSRSDIDNGWFHDFGLSYDIGLPKTAFTQEDQTVSLNWTVSYNDGAFETDSGFSHTTWSASTTWEWKSVYLSPLLAYQLSMEDTVNSQDDVYVMISTGVSF